MFSAWWQTLRDTWEQPWRPLGKVGLGLPFALAASLALLYSLRDDGWVPLLDSLNLAFHEAGHPVFGLFGGETLTALGGTLMQFLVPLIVVGEAWRRREAAGMALAWIWAAQNFLPTARYLADARVQELPLVGGGDHDWAFLLGEWGLLQQDLRIAAGLRLLGWLLILAACAWTLWRWHRDR